MPRLIAFASARRPCASEGFESSCRRWDQMRPDETRWHIHVKSLIIILPTESDGQLGFIFIFERVFAPVKLKYYGDSWTADRNSNQHWLFTSILTGICSCLCFKVARTAVQCLICWNCLRSWLYCSHSSRLGLVTFSIASIYAESGANGSCGSVMHSVRG